MPSPSFQALFCKRFRCPPSQYEQRMLRKCLYWHARWLGPMARLFKRDFFAQDLQFIRHLGASVEMRDVTVDLLNFRDANLGKRSFWRTSLKIRVSGRKADRLARQLFAGERRAELAVK